MSSEVDGHHKANLSPYFFNPLFPSVSSMMCSRSECIGAKKGPFCISLSKSKYSRVSCSKNTGMHPPNSAVQPIPPTTHPHLQSLELDLLKGLDGTKKNTLSWLQQGLEDVIKFNMIRTQRVGGKGEKRGGGIPQEAGPDSTIHYVWRHKNVLVSCSPPPKKLGQP